MKYAFHNQISWGKYASHHQISWVKYMYPGEEVLQRYFDQIARHTVFEKWFFGHWHMDEVVDNFQCLYNEMVELIVS